MLQQQEVRQLILWMMQSNVFRRYRESIENYKNVLFAANEPLVLEIQELMKVRGLAIGDLWVYDHWGKTADGRVVLLDYGLTDEIWNSHYTGKYNS